MSRASVITITLGVLIVGGCKKQGGGRDDALAALAELAKEQPGMAFGSMFSEMSGDPRIHKGEQMRPDSVTWFSMFRDETASIKYSVFILGDAIPPAESFELNVAGLAFQPKRIDVGSWGESIDDQIDGRFTYFDLIFEVPRDQVISALIDKPTISLSCPTLTKEPWTFESPKFAARLGHVREVARSAGDPAMEVHLFSREIDFYSKSTEEAQQDAAGQPATTPRVGD